LLCLLSPPPPPPPPQQEAAGLSGANIATSNLSAGPYNIISIIMIIKIRYQNSFIISPFSFLSSET
jgi:hypothetical protein